MPSILVLTVDNRGESRRLEGGKSLILGRSKDADWYLADNSPEPALSRQHCRVEVSGCTASVTDLGSRNGTWLNGVQLQTNKPALLNGGEVLELGPYRITVAWVRSASPSSRPPAPAHPSPAVALDSAGSAPLPPSANPPPRASRADPLDRAVGTSPMPVYVSGGARKRVDPAGAPSPPQREARPLRPPAPRPPTPEPDDLPDPFGLGELNKDVRSLPDVRHAAEPLEAPVTGSASGPAK